jgi:N-hydroxyarylamine O-acetyltransferase
MVLLVDIGGRLFVADVGFGGHLLAAPLQLAPGIEQETPAGVSRFLEADGSFTLQARLGAAWQDVYRFTLEPQLPIDHEVGNWYTATHPQSRFRNSLMVQRVTPEGRLSLLNRRLVRRGHDGGTEETLLAGPAALGRALTDLFGLDLPADPAEIDARLPPAG